MTKRILITGGAGFIGSHLADELLRHGYGVRVLDCLTEQVHGPNRSRPAYLHPEVELVVGDVRNHQDVNRSLEGIDAVYHFAAAVGVGQSMYEIAHYTSVNNLGTAVLLEALTRRPIERLVVASSMSIYGEGAYRRPDGRVCATTERSLDQLKRGDWELRDADGTLLEPIPTPETKPPVASSVYALSKYDQERLCLIAGNAYRIPTVALRFFNVYGPRQALSNPYTGVLAIFASRYLNGEPPLVFEDGYQKRDFVDVRDLVRACRLALETPAAAGQVLNIGSGQAMTIREVAAEMAEVLDCRSLSPEITGRYRVGDIRHCFADISQASEFLNYQPQIPFREGLLNLAQWLAGQVVADRTTQARTELATRGLMV
jgi:dTDP-L-rhamnose 4-epimerase